LHQICENFGFFGCKSFFCPFYDVLSCLSPKTQKQLFFYGKLYSSRQKYQTAHLHDGIKKYAKLEKPPVNTLGDMACPINVWDFHKFSKSQTKDLHQIFENFGFFGCKSFFCPFNDVLSNFFFFRILNVPNPNFAQIFLSKSFVWPSYDIWSNNFFFRFRKFIKSKNTKTPIFL
jgi:hypothetical protein